MYYLPVVQFYLIVPVQLKKSYHNDETVVEEKEVLEHLIQHHPSLLSSINKQVMT